MPSRITNSAYSKETKIAAVAVNSDFYSDKGRLDLSSEVIDSDKFPGRRCSIR